MSPHPSSIHGVVWEIKGEWTQVHTPEQGLVKARLRGKLKLEHASPDIAKHPAYLAIGDRVRLSLHENDWRIDHIEARKTYFARYLEKSKKTQVMASNIDQVVIIASLCAPYVPFVFIDSVVVTAASQGIVPVICFNKSDLYQADDLSKVRSHLSLYQSLGYDALCISVEQREQLSILWEKLKGKTSLLMGFSGCGKTSLINQLLPEANAKTQEVGRQNLGTHTTTFSRMYSLPSLGEETNIIDSPGIRFFSMPMMKSSELRMYFKEFVPLQEKCAFIDCTHLHEAHCEVIKQLNEQHIDEKRYFTYVSNFKHLVDLEERFY